MTRRRLTPDQREDILDRQTPEGAQFPVCPLCEKDMMGAQRVEYDHDLALGLGGADDPDNISAVHARCHRKKTTEDWGRMTDADRQGGRTGQRRGRLKGAARKIPGRRFNGEPIWR